MRIQVTPIVRATAIVTAITLVVKALGFIEKVLLAYFFGTGVAVDAYLVAYTIPFSAFVVLSDVVGPAFLPTFLRTWRTSEQEGWRLVRTVGILLLALLGVATAAGILFAAPLISVAAPGFSGAQYDLAVRLTRLAMPALLFLGLSTLTTAVLHAQKRFTLPALATASLRVGPLLLLLVLGGVQGLALGVVLGAVGKLLLEGAGLAAGAARGLGRPLRWALRGPVLDLAFPPVRTVGRLAAPLLAALTLSLFVGPLVENAFASRAGVGGVSALAYARKIAETLTTILPYTLGLVLLPFSAEMAARQDDHALAATLTGAVRAMTLLFLPVTVGLMVLREPFVRMLLERGAFTAASTQLTAGPLFFYALALLPFALEVIVIPFFFARQDTLRPVIADVLAFLLNLALIPPSMAAFGLGGIALAAAAAKAVKVGALLALFGRQVPAFRLASLVPFAAQMALGALAAAVALLAWLSLRPYPAEGQGLIALIAYLAGAGIVAAGAFFLVAYLLQVAEVRSLWRQGKAWCQSLLGNAR